MSARLPRSFRPGTAISVRSPHRPHPEEIDEIIASHLKKGWTLSRISKPSLAILRLAVYEMKYLDNVPQSVSINEAVELAKKYTIDESKFVNGILGTYSREISGKSEK